MDSLRTINTLPPNVTKLISSLSLKSPKPSFATFKASSHFKFCSIKASISSQNPKNPNPKLSETLNPFSNSLVKSSCIATITIAALLFSRFILKPSPVFATPVDQTIILKDKNEKKDEELTNAVSEEEEKTLEENANADPLNLQALRLAMECKVKNRKFDEAIGMLNRLIEIEPDELEWLLLKAHIFSNNGDSNSAKSLFEEVLVKNSLCVEAYHGVVMAISESETEEEELKEVLKRIEMAMEKCNADDKKEDLRDFKLLVSQIKVMEGNLEEALEVYKELVIEEPKDFRPYLCQAIIYTLLQKKDEAEEQFRKYQLLVPKEHPYAQLVSDNMPSSNVFTQKGAN